MQKYIYIFKGDDTDWNGEQFLTVNITSQTADLSNMTAKFILGSYVHEYPLTTGSFDIDLNAATTGSYAYGPICGTIKVIDEENRIKTVANRIPFYITDQVIAEQSQTLDIAMPEGSEISLSLEVGKDAQITVDEELSTTSPNPVQNKVITLALEGKQNNLTATQLNAANSGVTSAKVAQIDTNASNITSLQTASANNYTKTNLTAGTNISITPSQADPNVFEVNNTQDISGLTTDVTDLKANALKNTATATGSLVILGTPTWGTNSITIGNSALVYAHGAVAIGQSASITNGSGVAIGSSAKADGQGVGIGKDAKAQGYGSIQLGTGTNSTAKTLQVYTYQLLDGNTGKIPADRLPVKYRFCTGGKCGIDKSVIPWLSTNQAFVFTFSFRTPPLKNFANGQAIVITGNTHYDIGFELVMDWEDASETKARIGVGLTTENSSWNLGWTWSDYSLEPLTWYKVRLTYDLSKYTVEYAPENSDNWTTIKEATSSDKLYCNSDISLTQQSSSSANAIWKYGEVDINSFKATSGNTTYIDGVYSLRNLITLPTNSSQVKEYYEIG